ncbi:hypothetical protein GXW83_15490 [Streptacidiphilus sp. PB12-B1b]|uniref:hypothetical protein n=1 Tax=Streptacidiphilus sp. PB12-B1b TaxID=2705012 RepID=UPI0015FA60E6|nr:hypothetical protein [Streptacidiphilus sp. PB12-B1b]QMU76917.1 hypothetical protein GXW83_15490 [Streptacidiphilus sp. PB12-B1b]
MSELLQRLQDRLANLAADAPVAALRAVAALERLAQQAGLEAAFNVEAAMSWQTMGDASASARTRSAAGYGTTNTGHEPHPATAFLPAAHDLAVGPTPPPIVSANTIPA